MRVAVIGAGGVGGYFGGRLAQAGNDVTFIVRGATLQALRTSGLRIDSPLGDVHLQRVQATDDPSTCGPVDVILMAVKAWQLEEAARQLAPLLGADSMVVPLENGIDAPAILEPLVGARHVVGGLCAIVSFIVAPGHIRHAPSEPMVMFGELDRSRSERTLRLREVFEGAGVKAEIPDDILRSMWTKFLFIAPLSGFGALTRVPVGEWRSSPEIRALVTESLREIVSLAATQAVDLGEDAVAKTWLRYDALAPESTASLQRDVLEGKPSELEAQLGAIVRLAERAALPVPVTAFVYHALLPQERRARGTV